VLLDFFTCSLFLSLACTGSDVRAAVPLAAPVIEMSGVKPVVSVSLYNWDLVNKVLNYRNKSFIEVEIWFLGGWIWGTRWSQRCREYGEKSAGAVRILEAISLYIHADIRSKWRCSLYPLATDGGKAWRSH
jgi:hypothetical protein